MAESTQRDPSLIPRTPNYARRRLTAVVLASTIGLAAAAGAPKVVDAFSDSPRPFGDEPTGDYDVQSGDDPTNIAQRVRQATGDDGDIRETTHEITRQEPAHELDPTDTLQLPTSADISPKQPGVQLPPQINGE